ncbi:MAG: MOSC domain-containing protein [Gammaproteobacteria bacterium]|nr:MOSC domain-containing protein [Gammaproteobacteria bacterium]
MQILSITRYPIKGFAGEALQNTLVRSLKTLPGDRQHALQYADRIPPSSEGWRPKKYFLQSAQTNLCSEIHIEWNSDIVHFNYRGNPFKIPRTALANGSLPQWIASLAPELGEFTLETLETGFTDERDAYVSLVNRSTVSAIAEATGTSDHPERYRGNLLVDGVRPFDELNWVGQTLQIGTATFEVVEPIVRCKATECDWHGSRTEGFLDRLDQQLDTDTCGLFLRVVGDGEIKTTDQLKVLD